MMHADARRAGQFFDRFADTFDSLYDGQRGPIWRLLDGTFRWDIGERFRLTFAGLGSLKGRTILDIGCGSGVYIRQALALGAARVIGLDSAPRMLELARQRLDAAGFAGRYDLVEGTFPATGVDVRADAAIVMGVLDYVADPVPFLEALRNTSALSAISFPSFHWARGPIRHVRYTLRNCPLFLYRRDRVEDLLARAGLEAVSFVKIRGAGQDFHVVCR